ncbi:MAG: DNA primase [Betaproteobacteria bacterium]|nr:DNA primase [Betaproteobacteria bacterium]
MIPSGFIQDLLTRVDIVEVVARHVELKKAGINHKGLCPFHGEKTPSFIVSPSRQTYHCFGCGVHGDAVRFLNEFVGLGFVEAVQELAQQVGMTVPDDDRTQEERQAQAQRRQEATTLTDLMAQAAAHYRQQLRQSETAVAYLKGRGLTGEIAKQFGIGYAADSWHGLASAFPSYDDPKLEAAGLVIVHDAGTPKEKRYDRFRHRIMFPIRSVQGEVIGFGGRVLDGGEPKYLNSPETPVFVKGRELYGLYEARTAIRKAGYALVVEGYMDVVALAQSGLGHAVATLGTACTEDHVRRLMRFTDSVVFSFDGDAAGRKAAARALEACLPHASDTRSIRFLFLPPEHDPDSFVREHGTSAFEEAVNQAVPLSRQMLAMARQGCELDTPEGRARFAHQAHPLWSALPEGALQRQMLQAFAQEASLPVQELSALWGAMGRARSQAYSGGSASAYGGDAPHTGAPDAVGLRSGLPDAQASATGRYGFTGQGRAPGPANPAARSPSQGSGHSRRLSWAERQAMADPMRRGTAPPALRRAPRSPADWVTQLLLKQALWWSRLSAEDLDLLNGLAPPHATLLRWLERDIEEHGPRPWAALKIALQDVPELGKAWRQLQHQETDESESSWDSLRRALDQLHLDRLSQQQTDLAERAGHDPSALAEYQRVFERWKSLKQALARSASSDGPG